MTPQVDYSLPKIYGLLFVLVADNFLILFVLPFEWPFTRIDACLWYAAIAPAIHGIALFAVLDLKTKSSIFLLWAYVVAVYVIVGFVNLMIVDQAMANV